MDVTPVDQETLASLNVSLSNIFAATETLSNMKLGKKGSAICLLLLDAYREVRNLLRNVDDLTMSSLNVRNIMEIYIILLEISSSDEALKDWFGQVHYDRTELNKYFIDVVSGGEHSDKVEAAVLEIKEIQAAIDRNLKNNELKSSRPFNIKEISKKHGVFKKYYFAHKLCSKLMHPSSYRINLRKKLHEDNVYINLILFIGLGYSKNIEAFSFDIINVLSENT